MTAPDDWDRWTDNWRTGVDSATPDHVRATVEREERRLRRARITETFIVVAGIVGVGAALIHTHDPIDLITAAVTISGLLALLFLKHRSPSDKEPALAGTTSDFVNATTKRLRLQLRAIGFIWIAIALNLVFFLPWWISGYSVHRAELDAPVMLASWWFPLVAIAGLTVWSVLLRRRLKTELTRLRELESAYRDN